MIINLETKAFQTRNDKPNENWIGEGWAVVPQEYEQLILENYPYININTENEVVITVDVEAKQQAEARKEKENEILELKKNLADTDYKAIKYAEGQLSEEEYAETKAQRQGWRNRINELELEV